MWNADYVIVNPRYPSVRCMKSSGFSAATYGEANGRPICLLTTRSRGRRRHLLRRPSLQQVESRSGTMAGAPPQRHFSRSSLDAGAGGRSQALHKKEKGSVESGGTRQSWRRCSKICWSPRATKMENRGPPLTKPDRPPSTPHTPSTKPWTPLRQTRSARRSWEPKVRWFQTLNPEMRRLVPRVNRSVRLVAEAGTLLRLTSVAQRPPHQCQREQVVLYLSGGLYGDK